MSVTNGRCARGALGLSILTCVAGCATLNPVSGRLQFVAMSERQEETLGKRLLEQMRQSPGLLEESELTDYIQEVGSRVASISAPRSYSYRFFILDTAEANAYALPGGTVVLTRGLLAHCVEEAEVAGVIGHEIGHILARHAASRAAVTLPADLIARILARTVGVFDAEESQRIRDRIPALLVAPYTRGQEREADRVAAVLSASLGYEPTALAVVLMRMTALRPAQKDTDYGLASHPPTPERVAILETLGQHLTLGPGAPVAASREALMHLLDGISLGPSQRVPRVHGSTVIIPHGQLVLEYPRRWSHQVNGSGHVAVAPGGGAVVSLRALRQEDSEPEEAFLRHAPLRSRGGHEVENVSFVVAGEPPGVAHLYRFTHAGQRYELAGYWQEESDERWAPIGAAIATSAHAATPGQLAWLSDTRLRVVAAVEGESVEELAARTGSAWTGDQVARANGLPSDAQLQAGQLVKIARRETSRPRAER